ncbi:MAG: NAD(+)/NADH kinase [Lachnospiraceae bacterium]|nr:NAD(+)/NADH kinase [Lachnospiraceae bacterium]
MKHFLIIANDRTRASGLLPRIVAAIEEKGASCGIYEGDWMKNPKGVRLPDDVQCIITVGGDGTLIGASKIALDHNIPLVGVNRGHLGYLCDLDERSVFDAIEDLVADHFTIEERMLLSGHIEDETGGRGEHMRALNDVVISSNIGLLVMHIRVYINGQLLYSFNGDGMIFATPTGSTAYNMSAKGPIVDPKTDVILMTPINPHTLNTRSMVLDASDRIALEICRRHDDDEPSAAVSFDGEMADVLRPGMRVFVRRAKDKVRMIRFTDMSFLERIRRKMREE